MNNELNKGFTGIKINGVRFSNISEMLCYIDRQREYLIKAKEIIREFYEITTGETMTGLRGRAEKFLCEV